MRLVGVRSSDRLVLPSNYESETINSVMEFFAVLVGGVFFESCVIRECLVSKDRQLEKSVKSYVLKV